MVYDRYNTNIQKHTYTVTSKPVVYKSLLLKIMQFANKQSTGLHSDFVQCVFIIYFLIAIFV